MSTIEDRLIAETYDLAPIQLDAGSEAELTLADLCNLTLYGEADGQTGAIQSRVRRILNGMAQAEGPPGTDVDRQAYDEPTRAAIEQLATAVVTTELAGQWFLSESGRVCLPEGVTLPTSKPGEDPRNASLRTYVLGYAAGVIGRLAGRDNFGPATKNTTLSDISIESDNLLRTVEDLGDRVRRDPSRLLEVLDQAIAGITSPEELQIVQTVIGHLLPGFLRERVAPVKAGKQLTRTQVNRRIIARVWAVEAEDLNIDRATMLVPDVVEIATLNDGERALAERALKSQRYTIAGALGELQLTRDLLSRDLASMQLPLDIKNLVSIFLMAGGANARADSDVLYSGFCDFLSAQLQCTSRGQAIEKFMGQTLYWQNSGRRQVVTPDTYRLSTEQSKQIAEINGTYLSYFGAVVGLYRDALGQYESSLQSKLLIDKLEGGLPAALIPLCRRLMNQAGSIDSLRFDLIPDASGRFWVGEAQIISGGTPPAVLYRQAFERLPGQDGLIADGVLDAFVNRVRREADGEVPLVAILYSERPYSSDISRTTSWAGNLAFIEALKAEGIDAQACFANELIRSADGQLYFARGSYTDKPVTTIYNRVDYVSGKGTDMLYSDAMQSIFAATADQRVNMFPSPYPILFGKGVYALIWDPDFEPLLRRTLGDKQLATLRSCTPPTYWVSGQTNIKSIDASQWVRKGSYSHATQGLVIGADDPALLASTIEADGETAYAAVVQRYIDSARPEFRVLKAFRDGAGTIYRLWAPDGYRLRVEPTSIDGRVVEVFVTGSQDRVVHGRGTSVMTVASRG